MVPVSSGNESTHPDSNEWNLLVSASRMSVWRNPMFAHGVGDTLRSPFFFISPGSGTTPVSVVGYSTRLVMLGRLCVSHARNLPTDPTQRATTDGALDRVGDLGERLRPSTEGRFLQRKAVLAIPVGAGSSQDRKSILRCVVFS
jgi:hypothetical protein